jgi:hypothetical protein
MGAVLVAVLMFAPGLFGFPAAAPVQAVPTGSIGRRACGPLP